MRSRVRRGWREYTRMRTAIYFLIGICLIVLVGSFVPQEHTSQQIKVDEFLSAHHNLNALGTALGLPLTSVFVSPLFLVLLGSLYIALAACVLSRGRALIRRTIRGHWRKPQYWGEVGSWTFHTSFCLLLVAVVWGKATGFEGVITVTEGERVTEAAASYDTLQEGLLFNGRHAGYQVGLNSFSAPILPTGLPADFVSNVTIYDQGRSVMTRDVRVNDFLSYDGVDVYQQDYGWAPEVVVRNPAGTVVSDSRIQLFGSSKAAAAGVLKVPGLGFTLPGATRPVQLGAHLALFPDDRVKARVDTRGRLDVRNVDDAPGSDQPRNPVLMVQLFVGDLGLDRGTAQNVAALDTSAMVPYFSDKRPIALPLHESLTLPLTGTDCTDAERGGCFTISFADLRQFSLFHVKKDVGVPLVYTFFVLTMTGLLLKLYLRPVLEHVAARRAIARPVRHAGQQPGSRDPARRPLPVRRGDRRS